MNTETRFVLVPEYSFESGVLLGTKTGRLYVREERCFDNVGVLAAGSKAACEAAKRLLEEPKTMPAEPYTDALQHSQR